jgi:hypothetical protein
MFEEEERREAGLCMCCMCVRCALLYVWRAGAGWIRLEQKKGHRHQKKQGAGFARLNFTRKLLIENQKVGGHACGFFLHFFLATNKKEQPPFLMDLFFFLFFSLFSSRISRRNQF